MTEERIAELGKIDVKSLPLNQAIKYVKGKGERTLYIFSDPDCPYCQRLEQNMVGVDNVTVYVFLYPLTSLHQMLKRFLIKSGALKPFRSMDKLYA